MIHIVKCNTCGDDIEVMAGDEISPSVQETIRCLYCMIIFNSNLQLKEENGSRLSLYRENSGITAN